MNSISFIIFKFIKFSVVGFSGMVIDFSITFLLKEKMKINQYLANAVGFLLAASSNYIFNRVWTFSSEELHVFSQYSKFILIAFIGLIINHFTLKFLNENLNYHFYFSKFFAIGVVVVFNFFGNYFYTF